MKETIIKEAISQAFNEAKKINQRKEKVRQNKANQIKLSVLKQLTEKVGKETLGMILKEERMIQLK